MFDFGSKNKEIKLYCLLYSYNYQYAIATVLARDELSAKFLADQNCGDYKFQRVVSEIPTNFEIYVGFSKF